MEDNELVERYRLLPIHKLLDIRADPSGEYTEQAREVAKRVLAERAAEVKEAKAALRKERRRPKNRQAGAEPPEVTVDSAAISGLAAEAVAAGACLSCRASSPALERHVVACLPVSDSQRHELDLSVPLCCNCAAHLAIPKLSLRCELVLFLVAFFGLLPLLLGLHGLVLGDLMGVVLTAGGLLAALPMIGVKWRRRRAEDRLFELHPASKRLRRMGYRIPWHQRPR